MNFDLLLIDYVIKIYIVYNSNSRIEAYLDLAVVGAGGQRVAVAAEGEAEHGLVHAHVLLVRLVAQVLADLAGREVPHLHQPVHRARH